MRRQAVAEIAVVADDPATTELIDRGLTAAAFAVRAAPVNDSALRRVLAEHPDLAIVDLTTNPPPGLRLLGTLAEHRPTLPVIALTPPGQIADRVRAFQAGAADCIDNPFALAELKARIHARLRAALQTPPTTLRHDRIELDLLTRTVRNHGQTVRLTNTEFDLLAFFMTHPGQLLTRPQLLRAVWRYEHDPATNILQVYVRNLRQKLARDERPVPITTVRSCGYWFGHATTAAGG